MDFKKENLYLEVNSRKNINLINSANKKVKYSIDVLNDDISVKRIHDSSFNEYVIIKNVNQELLKGYFHLQDFMNCCANLPVDMQRKLNELYDYIFDLLFDSNTNEDDKSYKIKDWNLQCVSIKSNLE